MKINCEFQPCEDCESRSQCWKYWKHKAFITANAYEGLLNHLDKVNNILSEAENILRRTNIVKTF